MFHDYLTLNYLKNHRLRNAVKHRIQPILEIRKLLSSEELAETLERVGVAGKSTADFIIGGSYGLSEAVKRRADIRLSMSRMTFPHQMARVILSEQIYRAFEITSGGKYHK